MTFKDAIYHLQQANRGREVEPDDPPKVLYAKGVVDGRYSRVSTEFTITDNIRDSEDYRKGWFRGVTTLQ